MSYAQATYDTGPARWLVFSCVAAADGPGVTRITLTGELDLATAPQLRTALSRAAEDAELVVVDLSELKFMDSTGIQTILTADAQLRAAGRRLALVPGPPQVQRVFELTGLADKLPFVSNCDHAHGETLATHDPRPVRVPRGWRASA